MMGYMTNSSPLPLLTLLACSLLLGGKAEAASAVGTVTAQVIQPLTITGRTALDFGTILPGSGGGEVVITTSSQRQVSGAVKMQDGASAAATFNIQGTPDRSYTIETPDTLVFHVTDAYGSVGTTGDLTVRNFTASSQNSGKSDRGVLDSTGRDKVSVGATLVVPANVTPGRYSGAVPITVSY